MEEVAITVLDDGPYLLKGPVTLLDGEGKPFKVEGDIALCRCGLAGHKPFCDGTHRGQFKDKSRSNA